MYLLLIITFKVVSKLKKNKNMLTWSIYEYIDEKKSRLNF